MDTLDNANNPFGIPSISNKTDDEVGLFDDLKKNEDDLIKMLEKSNCEDRLSDCTDTTTDIDNIDIDRSISPNIDIIKHQTNDNIDKNQNFNPFNDIEKSLEINLNLKEGTFDLVSPSEENCQLPNNSDIHNVSQIIDAGAESDSEEDEEWNYVRGEEANKENTNPLIELKSEEKDEMSQLNPDAAEFVPESPTRNIVSPLGRVLNDELVLSESPKKPPINDVDLNVPSCVEFDKDISEKPHETIDVISNGHQNNLEETNNTGGSNNKFDEFHFGPNATPFTPNKFLDKSEASSTRAVFGDESALNCSFNDSNFDCDQTDFLTTNDDPMSMSFHQDRLDDSNPFDLNKVHQLPDDVDEFIKSGDDTNPLINDTISDLDEHFPLGKPEETKPIEQEEKLIEQDVEQIIESKEQEEIVEKHQTEEPETHQEIYQTFESEIHQIVQPEIHQIMEPLEDDDEPKILCDLKEKVDDSDEIPMKENKQDFEEKEISSSSEKEQESLNEDIVTSFMDDTSKDIERVADLIEEAKVFCDKIESTELFEPVTAEASPNNDEFVCFKTEKCEQEMAKEENVLIHTEECLIPSPTINQPNPFIEDTINTVEPIFEKEVTENKPQDEILLEFDVKTDSEQPTPESDQQLINNVDVIPINSAPTTDVNLLTDFQPSVISNEQIIEPSDNIVDNTPEVSFTSISHNITSTPCGNKTEESLIEPLSSPTVDEIIEIIPKITLEEASPKPETPKDEKKVTKSKATPSSTTKKTPTPRTPLSSKTSATSSKSTTPRSTKPLTPKVSSTTKTETTAPKPITKSATKTTTTAAKPLTSARLKPPSKPMESKNLTNGEVKSKTTTGTIKKLPEVSSARSTTSSTTTKTSSTTARVPLTARATTAPKPKPTTLKPTAPVKTTTTTATTKPSTTVRSTVPSRVPSASSKPATTSTVKAPLSKTISKPKTTVEKQTKETANKLTASKTLKSTTTTTTTQARNLTATKRSDEKITGTSTRTVTSTRTAATTKITAKKDTTTKTSLTKVGKPKENGVASVVTETIIVNNTTNGLNGGEQYVKDNSPIDNKLIVDTIENTAN